MHVTMIASDCLIKRVMAWASQRAEIRALLLIGSRARGEARPESDVDFVLLSATPSALVSDHAWISTFGTARQVAIEDYSRLTSVRVTGRSRSSGSLVSTGKLPKARPLCSRAGFECCWTVMAYRQAP